jgi:hypothetical protein
VRVPFFLPSSQADSEPDNDLPQTPFSSFHLVARPSYRPQAKIDAPAGGLGSEVLFLLLPLFAIHIHSLIVSGYKLAAAEIVDYVSAAFGKTPLWIMIFSCATAVWTRRRWMTYIFGELVRDVTAWLNTLPFFPFCPALGGASPVATAWRTRFSREMDTGSLHRQAALHRVRRKRMKKGRTHQMQPICSRG